MGVASSFVMNMLTSLPFSRKLAIWLVAFFSPAAYFVLLVFAARLPIARGVEEVLAVLLFGAIPMVALLVCESLVWSARVTVAWRIAGGVFTFLASMVQLAIIFVILRAILVYGHSLPSIAT